MGCSMIPHPCYLQRPFPSLLVEASKIKGLQFFPGDEVSFHVFDTALDLTLVARSARPVSAHYKLIVTSKPAVRNAQYRVL